MKKFLTQKNNFAYTVIVALVMVAGVSVATAEYITPGGGQVSSLIHRGGGNQSVSSLRLGACVSGNPACNPLAVAFDSRGTDSSLSWFAPEVNNNPNSIEPDFVFSALQNSYFLGKLFIGANAGPHIPMWSSEYGPFGSTFNVPLQKVNVYGNTLATNLQNSTGTEKVCITNDGTLVLCPSVTYYEYQCNDAGNWVQPAYGMPDGTAVGAGTVTGGVLEFDNCPAGSVQAHSSSGSYSTGATVCSTSTPPTSTCSATVPAFVCGGLTAGEWNPTSYGATNCPYADYSSAGTYTQGDVVCAPSGTPDNALCPVPSIPAFVCQSDGTWSSTGYGAQTCPYNNYSSSSTYTNGDLVCAPSGTPANTQCSASLNGVCGTSNGGTFSSTPDTGLCSEGTASTVSLTGNAGTAGSCSGTYTGLGTTGSCSGIPSGGGSGSGEKIDWEGLAFNWIDGRLYRPTSPQPGHDSEVYAYCGAPNDLSVNENVHSNAGGGYQGSPSACIMQVSDGQDDGGVMYELSVARNSWDRITVNSNGLITNIQTNYAPAYGAGIPTQGTIYRKRCDMNNNGTWSDDLFSGLCDIDDGSWENTGVTCNTFGVYTLGIPNGINDATGSISDGTGNTVCYMSSNGGGNTASCDGTNQSSCTSVAGCTWTAGSSTVNSCVGPTNESSCTSQNAACTWNPPVTGTQQYNWTCAGENGGTTVSCSATHEPAAGPGACTAFTGQYISQPADASNGCLSGIYTDLPDVQGWEWQCDGVNGGAPELCVADRVAYSWQIGEWGICFNGTQSRTVRCVDQNFNIVNNSLCIGDGLGFTPITEQSCGGGNNTTTVGCDQPCHPSDGIVCGGSLSCQGSSNEPPTNGPGICAGYSGATTVIGGGGQLVYEWYNC